MPEYYNVTTNLGDAEIANAIATNTKLNITHIAFGDGNGAVPTPTKTRTSLVREVHRQAVTKYERHPTNANWIVIETIIPSDIGGFTIREMGIIANGKLISHGSHAPFEKVADPTGVSEYRLKFTQNITDGSVVEIMLDESLIYASQAWVEENFIKRSEIVDNLTTNDVTKPVSAKQAKLLQDNKLGKTENAATATKLATARTIGGVSFDGTANINLPGVNAAGNQNTSGNAATATDCSRSVIAGDGLNGGGLLNADRTLTLGTPTKITSSSTNSVTTTSHTHEIDNASTSVAGVVKLNNTLTSTSTTEALTAAQGKVLNDQAFGIRQTKKDVKGVKVLGSTYTNTTPRPIYITITTNAYDGSTDAISIYVDNELFSNFSQNTNFNNKATVLAVVNPGSSYRVDGVLKMINKWIEVS